MPGRAFQLLFSIPLRQRLALADGDDADGAEAFAEARLAPRGMCGASRVPRDPRPRRGAAPRGRLCRRGPREARGGRAPAGCPQRRRAAQGSARGVGPARPEPDGAGATEARRRGAGAPRSRGAAREEARAAARRPTGARRPSRSTGGADRGRHAAPRVAAVAFPRSSRGRSRPLSGSSACARRGVPDSTAPPRDSRRSPRPSPAPRRALQRRRRTRSWPRMPRRREVFDTVRRVAPHRISVLVLGESGTGKELVAREVHRASGRSGPFVAVNVAALPETLAEAELFGAARGAFTGADRDRPGVVEASSGGTLFLDEIGDLSPQVQAKLLRVLQEREVRRLGETRTRAVDLRLVAATHRDLSRLASEGASAGTSSIASPESRSPFRRSGKGRATCASSSIGRSPERRSPRMPGRRSSRGAGPETSASSSRRSRWRRRWPGRGSASRGDTFRRAFASRRRRRRRGRAGTGRRWTRRRGGSSSRRSSETGGNRTRAAALLGLSRQSLLYEMKRLSITD